MAWHSAGTYRIERRPRRRRRRHAALRPAQQLARQRQPRQGPPPAVADQAEVRPASSPGPTCMILAGNVALESMGFETFGFAGGRDDVWEPEETSTGAPRPSGSATSATAATASSRTRSAPCRWASSTSTREGPNGNPDPLASARDIRETFAPHGDERRGDRRARSPAATPSARRTAPATRPSTSAPSPRARRSSSRAWAGRTRFGTGKGVDTITSGLEGAWTPTPTTWDNSYFDTLFGYEWELTDEPGRRAPVDAQGRAGARPSCPTRTTRPSVTPR